MNVVRSDRLDINRVTEISLEVEGELATCSTQMGVW
jgi:hypothetical protein